MPKVFVYGTLLCDDTGHNFWGREIVVRSSRHATIKASLFLEKFPYVVLDGKGRVLGKVFDVDDKTLNTYDEIEGVGHSWYARKNVEAILDDGKTQKVWVYCFGSVRGGRPISNGQFEDWFDTNKFIIPKDKGTEVRSRRP